MFVENKGIRVESTLPIAVYAHSETRESGDSFTILPTVMLGTQYVAVGPIVAIEYPNVIMAVAYQDNTTVCEEKKVERFSD